MTHAERSHLALLRTRLGNLTCDEALELAINASEILKDLRAWDPTRGYFLRQEVDFLKMAELLEKEANHDPQRA